MESDETEEPNDDQDSGCRRRRTREPLDFSPSSTATTPSHAAQDASETVQTGRHAYTENATFTKESMDAQSSDHDTLNQLNRDFFANEETNVSTEQRRQNAVNDTVAWGQRIGLTDYECERAVWLLEQADDDMKERHGFEPLILAALTLAANEGIDERNTVSKPLRVQQVAIATFADDIEEMVSVYESIRENLDVAVSTVTDCRAHLHDRVYVND